jgi:hypothetical protein
MKILITILTLTSGLAFGGTRDTAYNIICKNMTYDSDRSKCIEIIRPHNYFDDQALNICANFTFDSTKNQCLGYMAGKQYDAYEIDTCKNATFDSEKLRCLQKNGRPSNDRPCLPHQVVLGQLHASLNDLRIGNLGTVDKRLQYLIASFSNPSCQ